MRCALASMGFVNEDVRYNQKVMIDTMIRCSAQADIVIFGEAFLQGFYAATFDVEHDRTMALSLDDTLIAEIGEAARRCHIAVSFGLIEKAEESFYSSQLTIDANGAVRDLYRRVSSGWKLPRAGEQYREGDGFHTFSMHGMQIAVGLCGDLWTDENVEQVKRLHPDLLLWPSYTDFASEEWNTSIKHEYALQAGSICEKVCYVNPFCIDKTGASFAKGGAALFVNGAIAQEIPAGREDVLFVEV